MWTLFLWLAAIAIIANLLGGIWTVLRAGLAQPAKKPNMWAAYEERQRSAARPTIGNV
ncbi:membrane protein YqaA with SNARE-associated domain [Kaistia defluvii]|uniref:Membrane protein YqaA with SNARE-associated domain n=1 Tax=Kaistia defluvii TaxID=410841 RepID=A0ABV2R0L1_9HYPH